MTSVQQQVSAPANTFVAYKTSVARRFRVHSKNGLSDEKSY